MTTSRRSEGKKQTHTYVLVNQRNADVINDTQMPCLGTDNLEIVIITFFASRV